MEILEEYVIPYKERQYLWKENKTPSEKNCQYKIHLNPIATLSDLIQTNLLLFKAVTFLFGLVLVRKFNFVSR